MGLREQQPTRRCTFRTSACPPEERAWGPGRGSHNREVEVLPNRRAPCRWALGPRSALGQAAPVIDLSIDPRVHSRPAVVRVVPLGEFRQGRGEIRGWMVSYLFGLSHEPNLTKPRGSTKQAGGSDDYWSKSAMAQGSTSATEIPFVLVPQG